MENQNDLQETNRLVAPHEQRVIDERDQLASMAVSLDNFINTNPIFPTLINREQILMKKQLYHMKKYQEILEDRINSFSGKWLKPEFTAGEELIGMFGTENQQVFDSKYLAALLVDTTHAYGNDPRRNAAAATKIEFASMMGVKSIHSKPKNG